MLNELTLSFSSPPLLYMTCRATYRDAIDKGRHTATLQTNELCLYRFTCMVLNIVVVHEQPPIQVL